MCLSHTEIRVNVQLATGDNEEVTETKSSGFKLTESGRVCVKKIGNGNRHHNFLARK